MHKLFLAAAAFSTMSIGWADRLVLKDGTHHNGTFISGTSTTITFRDEGGVRRRFAVQNIDNIEFGSPSQTSSIGSTLGSSSGSVLGSGVNDSTTGRNRRRATAEEVRTLPAGTELEIRTNQNIESDSAAEGRTYSAQIEKEVRDSAGTVIIPRGSDVELVVSKVEDSGTLSSAELMLDIKTVNIDGRRYLINTAPIEHSSREGIGKNRRTAEMVGGGAAIGSVIGAIAGGGKGALIGAIIGAVGGGATQVITKGKTVNVPAETVLTFKLDQPVRLEPAGAAFR